MSKCRWCGEERGVYTWQEPCMDAPLMKGGAPGPHSPSTELSANVTSVHNANNDRALKEHDIATDMIFDYDLYHDPFKLVDAVKKALREAYIEGLQDAKTIKSGEE